MITCKICLADKNTPCNCVKCENCGVKFKLSDGLTIEDDKFVCSDCKNNYEECYKCETPTRIDEMQSHFDHDFCENCFSEIT